MYAGINLAEAALQVAAEDDAIVSHSTVQLPVHSFLQRITRLASSVNSAVIQRMPVGAAPDGVLQARPCCCHWQCSQVYCHVSKCWGGKSIKHALQAPTPHLFDAISLHPLCPMTCLHPVLDCLPACCRQFAITYSPSKGSKCRLSAVQTSHQG